MDLLIASTDRYKTFTEPLTLLQTITDLLINFTDRYKTSPTYYKLLLPAIYYTI